jgi:hypothetical protein
LATPWRRGLAAHRQQLRDAPGELGQQEQPQQLRAALERKLADIDARIAGLHGLRGELARRLGADMAACPLSPPPPPGSGLDLTV